MSISLLQGMGVAAGVGGSHRMREQREEITPLSEWEINA